MGTAAWPDGAWPDGGGGGPDEDDALPLELVGQPGKDGGQGGGGSGSGAFNLAALAALAQLSWPQSFHSDLACSVELVGLAFCSALAALVALAASINQA